MLGAAGLDTNFRFLVLKVTKQIEYIQQSLDQPEPDIVRRMKNRDDYVDHLKSIIENKCFSLLHHRGNLEKSAVDSLRAMTVITANLERIADYAVSVARQMTHFTPPDFFRRYDARPFFDKIFESLASVRDAFEKRDASKALEICRSEVEIDQLYKARFERVMAEMRSGGDAPNLVTSLFIFHYLERMGDSLLNIGEAILFYKLGEKLKLNQYQHLRETLAAVRGEGEPADRVGFEGIWETRSGCRIGKVSERSGHFDEDQDVIYKEGDVEKIRGEKRGIERWNRVAAGLAPRVVEYQEGEQDAAILLEYLEGRTLQQIVLDAHGRVMDEAMRRIQETIRAVWLATKRDEPVRPGFLRQLAARLDDVYTVHPECRGAARRIGGLEIPDFDELLRRNLPIDDALTAPFSVLGHGDFNLDNILFNAERRTVHFLDLHRSRQTDFAQDVSVFLVSNFRLPVFDRPRRRRTNSVSLSFFRFASRFAQQQGDHTFPARLALGLARSLVTSTRFEFKRSFAEEMMERAVYLIKRLETHRGGWESFVLPAEILVY